MSAVTSRQNATINSRACRLDMRRPTNWYIACGLALFAHSSCVTLDP
ncbi:hypothetical protein J0H58_09520 [bacterium]|nr:hypothetical protein [bacterium]